LHRIQIFKLKYLNTFQKTLDCFKTKPAMGAGFKLWSTWLGEIRTTLE
jgi:hypothetical protein